MNDFENALEDVLREYYHNLRNLNRSPDVTFLDKAPYIMEMLESLTNILNLRAKLEENDFKTKKFNEILVVYRLWVESKTDNGINLSINNELVNSILSNLKDIIKRESDD